MALEVAGLSAKELKALISQAEKQQLKLAKRPKASAMRAKIDKYVKDHGYTIAELYGTAAPSAKSGSKKTGTRTKAAKGRKLGKVAPKYRNPANADETWTGRGRQPRWLAELTASGKSADEFLISK